MLEHASPMSSVPRPSRRRSAACMDAPAEATAKEARVCVKWPGAASTAA